MLGFAFGVCYDMFSILRAVFGSKIIGALLDFIMMIIWAFAYFCTMIGYNNGEYRFYHSAVTVAVFVLYMMSIHKLLNRFFNKIERFLNNIVKKISKKLKYSKKSFKNLLHFGK